MNRFASIFAAFAIALSLSACATRTKMAFENDVERITEKTQPIFLMTATIKNLYRTSFQPKLVVLHVEKPGATDASGRLNFLMDEKARIETDALPDGNSYLLRMELQPGRYEILGMSSRAQSFPIIGHYFSPIHSAIASGPPGVFYLGHVEATVRERQDNEFKAGLSIPLIDQAIAGASGGTFDIEISDRWSTDEPTFRARFPALTGVDIQKAVLPPFDRAKAQKWWESH